MDTSQYRAWMGYACMNPECLGKSSTIDTHHIIKRHLGGPDRAWNYIALCRRCHRQFENAGMEMSLFFWKSLKEVKRHGFFLDEETEGLFNKGRLQSPRHYPDDTKKETKRPLFEATGAKVQNNLDQAFLDCRAAYDDRILARKEKASQYRRNRLKDKKPRKPWEYYWKQDGTRRKKKS